jgi:hypothetical protein
MKFTTAWSISFFLICCPMANPQGRPIDWPSAAGDAQRTGWEKADSRITKDNVKDFQLVMKRKLENAQTGPYALTPPVVLGLLISYRGFKELAFVAGSSDNLWAIDADMDRVFWHKHFDAASASASGPCAGGFATTPALIPPASFARPRPRPGTPRPAAAPTSPVPEARPTARGILGAGGFGAPRPVFAVASDGKLHLMNTSTGDEVAPAIPFLPANAKASSLTVADGVVYATTGSDCGGTAGVWAVDLNAPEPQVASCKLEGGVSHHGGLALGNDGTVYVQTGGAESKLLALSPKELKLQQSFTMSATPENKAPRNVTTPVAFTYKGRDLLVSAAADGSLYLLDSKSLDSSLYHTPPLNGVRDGLATWLDGETRWVLAPVWGHVSATAPEGAIVAFKVEEHDGKTVLTQGWVSRNISSPEPPVITSGIVFALSTGPRRATLYALDAATGKELYSTGDQVTAPGSLTGVTVANGRVFFTTTDSTLYGFGIYLER